MSRPSFRTLTAFCLLASGLALSAHAATVTWKGTGLDSNWSTPANWSSNSVPLPADTVVFNAISAAKPCTLDSARTVASLSFNAGYTGTLTATADLTVNGTFTLNSGTFSAGASTLTLGASFIVGVGATFSPDTSTVNFSGGGGRCDA